MIDEFIAAKTGLQKSTIIRTISLLEDGATIPFIARYRKEQTGNLSEENLFRVSEYADLFKKIVSRKETIVHAIKEQNLLTPDLNARIMQSWDLIALEDLYLPFKQKRKTKAEVARKNGLEPLAKMMMARNNSNFMVLARESLSKEVTSPEQAIEGAQHIIAEWISEDAKTREALRTTLRSQGKIYSKVISSKKEEAGLYKDYWQFEERGKSCPSHRILAILRGTKDGFLRSGISINDDGFLQNLYRIKCRPANPARKYVEGAISDSYKRLLFPSIENQIMNEWKEKAEETAIEVFTNNLRQLLLSPPLESVPILALDPGFKSGCKLVCINKQGDLLFESKIFPHPPQNLKEESLSTIIKLTKKYSIKNIAIGNGTAGRETYEWLNKHLSGDFQLHLISEDGASIYSASPVAREEFPEYDVTVRGAISIGRRLLDPLSELVKIDPKSLGVGQYQHDVNQTKLQESLDNTVVSCVNKIGVDLNKASTYLLQYISGLGPTLANNIVQYRKENGEFNSRQDLLKIPRMGTKTYEQCVGFLRIKNSKNPLDNTGIHPESYNIVEKIAHVSGYPPEKVIGNSFLINSLSTDELIDSGIGKFTLLDILEELKKPGLDPRGKAKIFSFDPNIRTIDDLQLGMRLPGIVSNVTNFGAFVNIGLKQDALLHISEISEKFISNPSEVISLGQQIDARIISIDKDRNRVNLSIK